MEAEIARFISSSTLWLAGLNYVQEAGRSCLLLRLLDKLASVHIHYTACLTNWKAQRKEGNAGSTLSIRIVGKKQKKCS